MISSICKIFSFQVLFYYAIRHDSLQFFLMAFSNADSRSIVSRAHREAQAPHAPRTESDSCMPVTRLLLSREALLPVQPCLQSAVRGVLSAGGARRHRPERSGDLEPPVRSRGSPVFETGPLPVVASQHNTRSGIRTHKHLAHETESCSFSSSGIRAYTGDGVLRAGGTRSPPYHKKCRLRGFLQADGRSSFLK